MPEQKEVFAKTLKCFRRWVAILLLQTLLLQTSCRPSEQVKIDPRAEKARAYVNGYAVIGGIIGLVGHIPGSTTAALLLLEVIMAYHVGKIFKGGQFDAGDAWVVTKMAGLASVVALAIKIAVLEALSFVPCLGWVVKAVIALFIVKAYGEFIIGYFESTVAPTPAPPKKGNREINERFEELAVFAV